MVKLSHLVALSLMVSALAGCGTHAAPTFAPRAQVASNVRAMDDSDHAQMNAIVTGVLKEQCKALFENARHRVETVAVDSYKSNHSPEAAALFSAQFDTDKNGQVTKDEYHAALAKGAAVEAYHHFTEDQLEVSLQPFVADKDFELDELRSFMVAVGLQGDWPLVAKVSDKIDLNGDGKFLDAPGEGPAFMLTFAQAQLEHALGLTVTQLQ